MKIWRKMINKTHIRIIGDIHGLIEPQDLTGYDYPYCYTDMVKSANYSVQVGDLTTGSYFFLNEIDNQCHKFVGGNHDNYTFAPAFPHYLGDYGTHSFPLKNGDFTFFFIRGEKSPNWRGLVENKNWWREEEIRPRDMDALLKAYKVAKPDVVISHSCPLDVVPDFTTLPDDRYEQMFGEPPRPTLTQTLLQECWDAHRPKWWFFGHFHYRKSVVRQDTRFVCVDKMDYFDVDFDGNFCLEKYIGPREDSREDFGA